MRALVLTQHFVPEVTAARFRTESFVAALTERGHGVDVLCPVPNHPHGVVDEPYRRRLVVRRDVNGARVTYTWTFTSPRKTFLTRLGSYGSYAAMAAIVGTFTRSPDVVLATSPPLSVGVAATVLARRHRVPWVLDVRDVWPDSAVALGELHDHRLIGLAERLERRLYRSSTSVVTVNDAFARDIAARMSPQESISVMPNGTTQEWLDAGDAEPDRASVGLPADRFVWAYAGNVGLAHGLEVAVEAAKLLGNGCLLLIIGEGPRRAEIERLTADAPPGLVALRPLMPPAEAARHLRASDALLVSERQERTVASKLYDYCALGRPVIAACRGELKRIVDGTGIGISVPHGDARGLARAVNTLREDVTLCADLAQRGREFARTHLRETQAGRMADLLETTAASPPA